MAVQFLTNCRSFLLLTSSFILRKKQITGTPFAARWRRGKGTDFAAGEKLKRTEVPQGKVPFVYEKWDPMYFDRTRLMRYCAFAVWLRSESAERENGGE